MTRLLHPAPGIAVALDAQGAPGTITAGPVCGRLEPLGRWLVEQDWWERPVAREYWKVLLRRGRGGERALPGRHEGESSPPDDQDDHLLLEVFHDLLQDAWFLERVYD